MHPRALVLLLATTLLACPPSPPAPTPAPAGGEPSCDQFCAHARRLGCRVGTPTRKGASCEAVCRNVQESGIASFDLRCGMAADSCQALDACDERIE